MNWMTRRVFIGGAGSMAACLAMGSERRGAVRFGMVTDIHYADRPDANNRGWLEPEVFTTYRGSRAKLAAAVERLNAERLDFLI